MSRRLSHRLMLHAPLTAGTALHVGAAEADPTCDLTVARNGTDQPYVPGTSLAGAVWQWAWQAVPAHHEAALRRLWGVAATSTDEGHASHLVFEDAVVTLPSEAAGAEIRDGIGIDRRTGAAAAHIKYEREVLPAGSQFDLELTVDVPDGDADLADVADSLVAALTAALQAGEVTLGAATSRGLGQLKPAADPEVSRHELNSRQGMLALLDGERPPAEVEGDAAAWGSPRQLTVTVDWQPNGPLMVKAGHDGLVVDLLPLTAHAASDGTLRLALPGSSVKGTLRSHAERILRTTLNHPAPPAHGPRGFVDQIGGLELIRVLFGAAAQPADADASARGGAGAVTVADHYSTTSWPAGQWRALAFAANRDGGNGVDGGGDEAGGDSGGQPVRGDDVRRLQQQLDADHPGGLSVAHHIAVDRWTAAPKDGALYTVLEPHEVQWPSLELTVDLDRLARNAHRPDTDDTDAGETADDADETADTVASHADETVAAAAIALWLLTLRDFAAGWVPLGFATTRGLGALTVNRVWVSCGRHPPELAPPALADLDHSLAQLPTELTEALQAAWQAYVDQHSQSTHEPGEAGDAH